MSGYVIPLRWRRVLACVALLCSTAGMLLESIGLGIRIATGEPVLTWFLPAIVMLVGAALASWAMGEFLNSYASDPS